MIESQFGLHIDATVSSKYEGGSNNPSSPTITSEEDEGDSANERSVKYSKSICQRFKNLRGLYNSQCYLACTFLLTALYFCVGLIQVISMGEPKQIENPPSESSSQNEGLITLIDVVLCLLAFLDMLFKLCEFYIQ